MLLTKINDLNHSLYQALATNACEIVPRVMQMEAGPGDEDELTLSKQTTSFVSEPAV